MSDFLLDSIIQYNLIITKLKAVTFHIVGKPFFRMLNTDIVRQRLETKLLAVTFKLNINSRKATWQGLELPSTSLAV